MARQIIRGVLIAATWPAYAVINIAAYANLQETRPAKIGMFLTFIPVLAFTLPFSIWFWIVIAMVRS
jgi:hypothetical protein